MPSNKEINVARELTVYGVTSGFIAVPAGVSLAYLMQQAPGEISSSIKYVGGGSLEIIGRGGQGATVVPTAGTGYLMSGGEAFNFDGAASYYLVATGATATLYFLKGLSQGF